jgi:hypothetical protein
MKQTWIAAAVAGIAVFAGVYYVSRPAGEPPAEPAGAKAPATAPAAPAAQRTSRSVVDPAAKPVPSDPRLAALMVSPDNGLIEYVTGPEGKVIREVDKDPNSPGFGKTSREYTYAGDRVAAVTSYSHAGDRVRTTRTIVTYKPDGSIDQFLESKD